MPALSSLGVASKSQRCRSTRGVASASSRIRTATGGRCRSRPQRRDRTRILLKRRVEALMEIHPLFHGGFAVVEIAELEEQRMQDHGSRLPGIDGMVVLGVVDVSHALELEVEMTRARRVAGGAGARR